MWYYKKIIEVFVAKYLRLYYDLRSCPQYLLMNLYFEIFIFFLFKFVMSIYDLYKLFFHHF